MVNMLLTIMVMLGFILLFQRKTNKGLKELTDCEYRKTDSAVKLNNFLEQKKLELEIEDNAFNRGMVKGLEIALRILNG